MRYLLLLALGGCVHTTWAKEGGDFERDSYECKREASYTSVGRHGRSSLEVDDERYEECLKVRGWKAD